MILGFGLGLGFWVDFYEGKNKGFARAIMGKMREMRDL